MPKCIVIGEDLVAQRSIIKFIEKQAGWELVSLATQPSEASSTIKHAQADVCLMDISLDGNCDFDSLVEVVAKSPCLWIFISSYPQFAASAFEIGAVDYVLKPFSSDRLLDALQKTEKRLDAQRRENQQMPGLKEIGHGNLVDVDDICWIGTSGDHSELHCQNRMWLCKDTLEQLESNLDPTKFVKVHSSAMVNIKKVSSLSGEFGESLLLRLSNGEELEIDQQLKNPLFESLGL